jgi:hypothetical protein
MPVTGFGVKGVESLIPVSNLTVALYGMRCPPSVNGFVVARLFESVKVKSLLLPLEEIRVVARLFQSVQVTCGHPYSGVDLIPAFLRTLLCCLLSHPSVSLK